MELVRRELAPSREVAQRLIAANRVLVGGSVATKPSRQVEAGESVAVTGPAERFVGRGAYKLDGALDEFSIDVTGFRGVDAGSSTGGFTDCLLQRGAREVAAIDVGYGQLHERLRADPRVGSYERTNVRGLDPDEVGGAGDIVVADLSFISLRAVLDDLIGLTRPGGHIVTLIKPQFEAGREEASKGRGIIRDPAIWRRVLDEVLRAVIAKNAAIMGLMVSPITGTDGNVEFLLHARTARTGVEPEAVALLIEQCVTTAQEAR